MQPSLPQNAAPLPSVPGGFLDRFKPSTAQSRVLRALWPYVWPHDRPDLRRTVISSLVLILIAKLITVCVPFTLKWATDARRLPPASCMDLHAF